MLKATAIFFLTLDAGLKVEIFAWPLCSCFTYPAVIVHTCHYLSSYTYIHHFRPYIYKTSLPRRTRCGHQPNKHVSGAHISRGGIQNVYQAEYVTIHLTANLLPTVFLNFKEPKIFSPKCRQFWVRKEKVAAWGKVEGAIFFCLRQQKKKKGM